MYIYIYIICLYIHIIYLKKLMQEPLHCNPLIFSSSVSRSPLPPFIFPAYHPNEASIEAIPMTTAQIMTFVFQGTSKIPKIVVSQIIHFNRDFHYKPSILGYPYFWKHRNQYTSKSPPYRKCPDFFSPIFVAGVKKKHISNLIMLVASAAECKKKYTPPEN